MALFQSDLKDALRKLGDKGYSSAEERDELLARVASSDDVKARDIVWMLFRPDRALRDAATTLLKRLRDPETLDEFMAEAKRRAEPAVRAAVPLLFAIGLPGLEQRLAQFVAVPEKATRESRELQEIARRIIVEAPPSPAIVPLLWQLEATSAPEERLAYLGKLAAIDIDERSLARWQQVARDEDARVRDQALEVLARRAPTRALPTLIEQLPHAGYSTQQAIVEALQKVAVAQGPAFADQLLPILASGDAASRTSVIKILLTIGDRTEVIRRYLRFAKSLAGFVRDRAIESLRSFGESLVEPTIQLFSDPDDDMRAAAISVAAAFEDPRIVPQAITLLNDPDWWIRIAAADTLGSLRDPRAVNPLVAALADPEVRWSAVESLGRIGDARALPALGKLLADPQPDVRVSVLQALRGFNHPQVSQAVTKVATSDPDRNVRLRALEILDELSRATSATVGDMGAVRKAALAARASQDEPRLNAYLIATRNQGASDFHLSVGQPPIVRLAADLLRAQGEPFTPAQTEEMVRAILTPAQMETLQATQQLDFCYTIPQAGRYRANVFIDHRGYNGVFRVIPEAPPNIRDIGLPPQLAEIADYHQGLVIVCGPSGSGKSTTLAALVNLFNETRNDHVITMEDPVEFVHPQKNCLVNQREIGTHSASFARALRAALREDPDVIVIGELRDNESISLALTAAETGHIVLGTLNSTGAAKAIDRVISSFPADEQPQIRAALAESLKYAIAQRLLPSRQPRKQVAAFEILKNTTNIAQMIRDEKTYQIYSAMQIGRSLGMQTFDEALKDLVSRDQIAPETAYMAALKKEDFEPMVSPEFLRSGAV